MRSARAAPVLGTFLLLTLLPGCGERPTEIDLDRTATAATASPVPSSSFRHLQPRLAELRSALAPFHRRQAAIDAGYPPPAPAGCWYYTGRGAMGYHYINASLFADPAVDLLRPEVLIYEPGRGGHERLVAVEYIVPLTEPRPGPLLGQEFSRNDGAGVWALHIWIWRNNPAGLFAPWNPKVSCEWADVATDFAP